ncbi:MAG: hypothetical protein KDN22_34375 [Verrucomicrobiae bacterium]|nr:hypothetical protein [Verrucomicrobiae bacterium]
MNKHQKLLWGFVILTLLAGGLWGWKSNTSQIPSAAHIAEETPFSDRDTLDKDTVSEGASEDMQQEEKDPVAVKAKPRRFIDMTARERLDILFQIKATDADALFQLFLDAGRKEQDPMKQSMLRGRLKGAIMEKSMHRISSKE